MSKAIARITKCLAAMISTLLVSGFVSRLGLAGLELDLVLPQHISARRRVRAGVRLSEAEFQKRNNTLGVFGAVDPAFLAAVRTADRKKPVAISPPAPTDAASAQRKA